MKVFKIHSNELYYAISANSEEEAKVYLFDSVGKMPIDKIEEIPESKWDEKIIQVYEDNNTENDCFYISIREAMDNEPMIVYTNDSF